MYKYLAIVIEFCLKTATSFCSTSIVKTRGARDIDEWQQKAAKKDECIIHFEDFK